MQDMIIFGAKSTALGACIAINTLYSQFNIIGFMVSSSAGNPSILNNLPVKEITHYTDKSVIILVAVPESVQREIIESLTLHGFTNVYPLLSEMEAELMRMYYNSVKKFPSLSSNYIEIYIARCCKDQPIKADFMYQRWLRQIQVGASLTKERIAILTDNTGVNISLKNGNYCELTALFWIWKNRISLFDDIEYYGLCHYRRFFDISENDIISMKETNIDVILPYPTIHLPNISEHHSRYLSDEVWESMLLSLKTLEPKYAEYFKGVLEQQYMFNYNMIIAKKEVLRRYCEWLFPIFENTEQICKEKNISVTDRYIGYLGENLLTLFFMYNNDIYNIKHVGIKFLADK